jgi:phosphate transport system protein
MKHAENELFALKNEISQMWSLVLSQVEKSKQAFLNQDIELALEIVSREKRINVYELKIDSDCENYIALYSPVAVDLRLVLSLIKLGNTLERIGDFCEGIARHVIENDCVGLDARLIENLKIERMCDLIIGMLSNSFSAFDTENTKMSGKILSEDNEIDTIYINALNILTEYLQAKPEDIRCGLKIYLLIRKLERIGDHCTNIVEYIVFYIDAKVLKHSGKKEKEEHGA